MRSENEFVVWRVVWKAEDKESWVEAGGSGQGGKRWVQLCRHGNSSARSPSLLCCEGWWQRWQHYCWPSAVASLPGVPWHAPCGSAPGSPAGCRAALWTRRVGEASVGHHEGRRGAEGRASVCAHTGSQTPAQQDHLWHSRNLLAE